MDRQRMEQCLASVAAYQASGQRSAQWATANGVKPRELAGWCAHARRWQAKLDGVPFEPSLPKTASGFMSATLPARLAAAVRIEIAAGATRVQLHRPLAHTRELARWLHDLGL